MSNFEQITPILHTYLPGQIKPLVAGKHYTMDEAETVAKYLGIGMTPNAARQLSAGIGMDTIQQPVSATSIGTHVQFLQSLLPGMVRIVTAARKADDAIGYSIMGAWEDAQIVQQQIELAGGATPYSDAASIPFAQWNNEFLVRTVVRFELGLRVEALEEAVSARIRVNSGEMKRESIAQNLEIERNAVAFYGFNSGNNLTYGLLNDPLLPAYVTVANPGAGTTWAVKTFDQIQADILTWLQGLRTGSAENVDPGKTPLCMLLPTTARDYLSKTTSVGGISVQDWLNKTYPNIRVESCVQFNGANGGSNVAYLFAETVDGSGTDDQRTFLQPVQAKLQLLGVERGSKYYIEDYSNATAGVMTKRPYAVYRASGI